MKRDKPLLVFDFDGTLCDSKDLTIDIINRVLRDHFGHDKPWGEQEFQEYFSRNVFTSLLLLLKHRFYLWPKFLRAYTLIAKEELQHADFFPEQKKIIANLAKTHTLVIVTSNSNLVVHNFLKRHRMLDKFKAIYGFEDGKNKARKLKAVMKRYDRTPKDVVFFTDTAGDVKETKKTGVHVIACSWGFQDREILKRAEPERIIDEIKEIRVVAQRHS